jgi:hypothetical protein
MNATTAADFVTTAKETGEELMVTLSDNTVVTGAPISVNSKGLNLRVDGKTRSFSLNRIDFINMVTGDDEDDMTDEEIYTELGDGMTTAELAAHLSEALNVNMTPKELRVHLRALGLGVGKGRKYSLSATEYRMVRDLVKAAA